MCVNDTTGIVLSSGVDGLTLLSRYRWTEYRTLSSWQWQSVVYIERAYTEDKTHIATSYNIAKTIRILLWLRHSLCFLLTFLYGRNISPAGEEATMSWRIYVKNWRGDWPGTWTKCCCCSSNCHPGLAYEWKEIIGICFAQENHAHEPQCWSEYNTTTAVLSVVSSFFPSFLHPSFQAKKKRKQKRNYVGRNEKLWCRGTFIETEIRDTITT